MTKATFSAVVDQALQGEPSVITRHGRREAVSLGHHRRGIETGIAKLRRTGASPRADQLTAWLEMLMHL